MVKWDRLLVLLNWKKVVHDVLIASQKATVDEQVRSASRSRHLSI
jgi:hypothetical protein